MNIMEVIGGQSSEDWMGFSQPPEDRQCGKPKQESIESITKKKSPSDKISRFMMGFPYFTSKNCDVMGFSSDLDSQVAANCKKKWLTVGFMVRYDGYNYSTRGYKPT